MDNLSCISPGVASKVYNPQESSVSKQMKTKARPSYSWKGTMRRAIFVSHHTMLLWLLHSMLRAFGARIPENLTPLLLHCLSPSRIPIIFQKYECTRCNLVGVIFRSFVCLSLGFHLVNSNPKNAFSVPVCQF